MIPMTIQFQAGYSGSESYDYSNTDEKGRPGRGHGGGRRGGAGRRRRAKTALVAAPSEFVVKRGTTGVLIAVPRALVWVP